MKPTLVSLLIFLAFIVSSNSQDCESQLVELSYTDCKIYYRDCDDTIGFQFNKCIETYCVDWDYDYEYDTTSCVGYADRELTESSCITSCCQDQAPTSFDLVGVKKCKEDDDQKMTEAGIIAGSVCGGIALIFICIIGGFYCKSKGGCKPCLTDTC